ncbi:MAG: hypothetical protein QXO12_02985 [Candidatus Pacearchaeota archaeon]
MKRFLKFKLNPIGNKKDRILGNEIKLVEYPKQVIVSVDKKLYKPSELLSFQAL